MLLLQYAVYAWVLLGIPVTWFEAIEGRQANAEKGQRAMLAVLAVLIWIEVLR